ncbi:hypothetical protein HYH70_00070 [Clostridium botulinum]|uniref:hypothetical protein n=1 Tax=Clostridium botulinum TaxID=1491 RepID=UPI00035BB1CD|nr:hypothetical protein [Clostridium botulinum]EPS51273.1 hypothetical protein CFSAN002367_07895 [Clostridium botulinum CFSAN002367]MBY6904011.1 hypothetical protein [Clostridium botulinum]MBY6925465.1 hypothetical protein [Clostridium botulinum]MBY6953388.1 hypothetical protein [Clostridium botulinum]
MVKYIIMSCIIGFTGNKLFNKKDKSNKNSIKWGCIAGSLLIIIYVIFLKL